MELEKIAFDHADVFLRVIYDALCDRFQQEQGLHSDSRICSILLALGIPPKLKGYYFLREAIRQYAAAPGQSITKELYHNVAASCNATAPQVERGIRTAIGIGWEQGNRAVWRDCFAQEDLRPSNGTFISVLAEKTLWSYAEPWCEQNCNNG